MYEKITTENVMMFAIKHYDNPQCEGEKEFHDDMKRFKYIKRLLKRYKNTGVLKTHLILNHLTVLFNVFDSNNSESKIEEGIFFSLRILVPIFIISKAFMCLNF